MREGVAGGAIQVGYGMPDGLVRALLSRLVGDCGGCGLNGPLFWGGGGLIRSTSS